MLTRLSEIAQTTLETGGWAVRLALNISEWES
jgi:hypothetical protein